MINLSKLSFYSGTRYEHVALKGHISFAVAGGGFASTTVTITHNLGYRPYFRLWYTYDNAVYYSLFAGTDSYNLAGNRGQIDTDYATTTTIVVGVSNFGVPAISGVIYYRIYAEPEA